MLKSLKAAACVTGQKLPKGRVQLGQRPLAGRCHERSILRPAQCGQSKHAKVMMDCTRLMEFPLESMVPHFLPEQIPINLLDLPTAQQGLAGVVPDQLQVYQNAGKTICVALEFLRAWAGRALHMHWLFHTHCASHGRLGKGGPCCKQWTACRNSGLGPNMLASIEFRL